MKALTLLTAAAVTLFSVAASAQTYGVPYGKGKARRRLRLSRKASATGGTGHLCRSLSFGGGMSAIGGKADIAQTYFDVRS